MEEHPMFLQHADGTVERLDAEGIRLAERNRILGVAKGIMKEVVGDIAHHNSDIDVPVWNAALAKLVDEVGKV